MRTRMRGLTLTAALAVIVSVSGCGDGPTGPDMSKAELTARVHAPTGSLYGPGSHTIPLDGAHRDPILYLPPGHDASTPAPLVVLFHGAGGSAETWVSPYRHADRLGLVLLIMQSRALTWDMVAGEFGPDVAVLDDALAHVFDRVTIDPDHVAFVGFSDGASYALTLTLMNSPLVRRGVGFSPGGVIPVEREPFPELLISHGTNDRTLPVDRTRRVVAAFRRAGFSVWYAEFVGGHEVPREISEAAFDWLVR